MIVTQEVSRTWGRSRGCTYTPQGFLILERDRSRRQPCARSGGPAIWPRDTGLTSAIKREGEHDGSRDNLCPARPETSPVTPDSIMELGNAMTDSDSGYEFGSAEDELARLELQGRALCPSYADDLRRGGPEAGHAGARCGLRSVGRDVRSRRPGGTRGLRCRPRPLAGSPRRPRLRLNSAA